METPDHPERSLPSPWPSAPSPPPPPTPAPYAAAPAWDDLPEAEAPAKRGPTPRLVLRALRRHWWQALLLWGIGSAALVALAAQKIKPTYEATAWLKVEPTDRNPLGTANLEAHFMETQVQLVTSPDVLGMVVQEPRHAGLPLLRSADPEAALRKALRVAIPPSTNLILVSMSSAVPSEAAELVNAVTQAYLRSSTDWIDQTTRQRIAQLREQKLRFEKEAIRHRTLLESLNEEGFQSDPRNSPQEALNTYRAYRSRLDQIELELFDAESTVATLEALQRQSGGAAVAASRPSRPAELSAEQQETLVQQAFLDDPEVRMLRREMAEAGERLKSAQRLTRSPSDPAVTKFDGEQRRLRQQYERLWQQKQPMLRRALAEAQTEAKEPRDPIALDLERARVRIGKLQSERDQVTEALEKIRIDQQAEGSASMKARFAEEDLRNARQMFFTMSEALDRLEIEVNGPAKVTLVSPAEPSAAPTSNKRTMVMAAVPVGMLGLVVVLSVLLELRGARVADPDELSDRLRLGVIGVVPPLPSLSGPARGPKALRDQRRRLEEFVQSLDHLRVTLCASAGTAAGRRCVMITSAVGGEGKTTLAAQLAGRCANAGLTTLLVDADLRRPSLGELLEVPEGPGLAEVLLGEAGPEEAMVVIGNAGGFHLLPAGGGGHDPSRLLQGERLGQLIARLREAFDVVLIDAPPVLPVPDALLVGRWTDGAVVAVRHDSSRFPLVERAQKRLTSIGVPLLGAVVNGVRPAESSYGAYDYYASAGREEI